MYYCNDGPKSGPILWRDGYGAIDVFGDPDDRTPIGTALSVGSTPNGIVIWELAARDVALPGCWIVLGREFLPRLPARPSADAPEGDATG
jgi:hypothetical protein